MSYATKPLILAPLGRGNHSCCYQTVMIIWIFHSDFLNWLSRFESLTLLVTSRVAAPWNPPTYTFSSTDKSQMQLNTDFHMHYIWMPVKKRYLHSLMNPNTWFHLSRKHLCEDGWVCVWECEITWAITLSCFFKTVNFMHCFYTVVAKGNKSNTCSKKSIFNRSLCKWL